MGKSTEPAAVAVADSIRRDHPGLRLVLHEDPAGHWALDLLVVPAEQREQGIGREAMTRICAAADLAGVRIATTPSSAFGGSVTRLRRFYAAFGFRPNRGRKIDHTVKATMLRPCNPAPTML
jgi:hypothetical protein